MKLPNGIDVTDYCFVHGVNERPRRGDYRLCYECNHIYRSSFELWLACVRRSWGKWSSFGRQIYVCPLCQHTFTRLDSPEWGPIDLARRHRAEPGVRPDDIVMDRKLVKAVVAVGTLFVLMWGMIIGVAYALGI